MTRVPHLEAAIRRLDPLMHRIGKRNSAVLLSCLLGIPQQRIASVLGISQGRVSQILKKLRAEAAQSGQPF